MIHCHPAIYITAKSRSATRSTFDPSDDSDTYTDDSDPSDDSDTYTDDSDPSDDSDTYTDDSDPSDDSDDSDDSDNSDDSDDSDIYTDISPNSLTPYGNRHATSILFDEASKNLAR